MTALARWLMAIAANPAQTAAAQWLERTLDDSANRRMSVPEAFLTADAILCIVHNIADGLQVFPAMIARNLAEELPLMTSEAILMEAVQRGGDRQAVHERLRIHARTAATMVLEEGGANPFLVVSAARRNRCASFSPSMSSLSLTTPESSPRQRTSMSRMNEE